jgi:DNA-binding NarL/FixJ family response regulator
MKVDELTNKVEKLTDKEIEAVQLLCRGMTAVEIAAERHRSVHTVRMHLSNAMNKLGVATLAGLVYQAIKHGYIPIHF